MVPEHSLDPYIPSGRTPRRLQNVSAPNELRGTIGEGPEELRPSSPFFFQRICTFPTPRELPEDSSEPVNEASTVEGEERELTRRTKSVARNVWRTGGHGGRKEQQQRGKEVWERQRFSVTVISTRKKNSSESQRQRDGLTKRYNELCVAELPPPPPLV